MFNKAKEETDKANENHMQLKNDISCRTLLSVQRVCVRVYS